MAGRMNLSQIRDALAQTMSEELITKGDGALYTRDAEAKWKLFDEALCSLFIYKQPLQELYRVVAMTFTRKCILNSWIKPTHTLTRTPPNFVEIQNSAVPPQQNPTGTLTMDGLGISFSDPAYSETFAKLFLTCQTRLANTTPLSPDIPKPEPPKSASPTKELLSPKSSAEIPLKSSLTLSMGDLPKPLDPASLPGLPQPLDPAALGELPKPLDAASLPELPKPLDSAALDSLLMPPPDQLLSTAESFRQARRASGQLAKSGSAIFHPEKPSIVQEHGNNYPSSMTLRATPTMPSAGKHSGSIGRSSTVLYSSSSGSTRSRKFTLTKKPLKSTFDSANLTSMQSVAEDIITTLDNLFEEVWQCLHRPPQVGGVNLPVNKVAEAIQMLSIITAAEFGEGSNHAKEVVISNATAVQEELRSYGADANVVQAVEKGSAFIASALRNTASAVGHHAVTIRGLSAQLEHLVAYLQQNPGDEKEVLLLVAVTRALATSVTALCSAISTYAQLNNPTVQTCSKFANQNLTLQNDVNIWQEVPLGAETKVAGATQATLNELIALLVSDVKYDPDYMKMFITMYESFTNPYILLDKLKQRHEVPSSVDRTRVAALQLRVAVLIKYWIDNHGDEFDDDVASRIGQFIETTLRSAGHGEMAHLLAEQLRKKTEARTAKAASLQTVPPHMTYLVNSQFNSLADLLLLTPPTILAEQLTMIDFAIFKTIEPRELQNQSWNKANIKASRSPNILRLINRSTQVSYWVATMILMNTKVEDRVKVWEKIIDIAKALLKMHNYNTLFSIIAGLNNSCVFRLKKTRKKLLTSARDTIAAAEKVMNTAQSFKNYRTALRDTLPPCLPYLGVHLSDLVFIEDGNADMINGQINVRKREQIYTAITELLHYQQYPFNVTKHSSYDYLVSLPSLSEKELYTISTFLEPRK